MIQAFFVKLFGVNYQTTIAGIFTVIAAVPGAVTMIQAVYGSTLSFPVWVTIGSAVCAFISYLYGAFMQKSRGVSGANGNAKIYDKGEMKTAREIEAGK